MHRLTLVAAALAACAAPGAAAAATVHFTTPSGNIDCRSDDPSEVTCVVEKGRWANQRAKPASCDWDWSPREVTLMRGGRIVVGACRGDIGPLCVPGGSAADACRTLGYGRSVRIGTMRCASARAGVTCRARNGKGRGFRVSRTALRVYR
ncbi:MAG: hypothetical protein KDC33_00540 [Thermoleophilia bacterium]|nr:hypothetical protein [Thermoleophilia bacterium]